MTSSGRITEYQAGRLAEFPEADVLEPAPALDGWTSFVAHRAVRAMAASRQADVTWIATWGGVLAWRRGDQYSYRRYSTEHGLAGAPSCIAVDPNDVPWVGHDEGGLSFFDGTRWSPHADLRDQPIRAICAASGGGVWAASTRGIYLVRRDQPAQEISGGHPGAGDVNALTADGDAVLVGSASGLYRMSTRGAVEHVLAGEIDDCTALARADDDVWVGTSHGVVRWTASGTTLVRPDRGNAHVVALAPQRDGAWVVTLAGVARVRRETWTTLGGVPDGAPTPRAVAAGPSEDYAWLGTDDLVVGVHARGGDVRWDLGLLPRHPEDEVSNVGRSAVVTADPPRVWIATGAGVFVADPDDTWRFDGELGDVRRLFVTESPGEPATVWMLCWPSGVMRTLASERLWRHVPLPPGLVTDIAGGVDRATYAIAGGGLWRLDLAKPALIATDVPEHPRALAQTPDGTWWVATTRGMFRRDGARWALGGARDQAKPGGEQSSGTLADVSVLTVIRGVLWAGGATGLASYHAGGWRPHSLRHGVVTLDGSVTAIAPATVGESLWLGVGGRVARYDPAFGVVRDVFDRFEGGLCGGAIAGLAESPGALWVASHGGIARLTTRRD